MTDISPEAQALIDRLAQMDPANPRHDNVVIERAINAHLGALGLPERSIVWAPDAREGYRLVVERGRVEAEKASGGVHDRGGTRGAARSAANSAARTTIIDPCWETASDAALLATWSEAESLVGQEWEAVWHRSRWAAEKAARGVARMAVKWVSHHAAHHAEIGKHWRAARSAGLSTAVDAVENAVSAVAAVNGQSIFDLSAIEKTVRVELPLFIAFEAGLFLYWITPVDVVCVLQPSLLIQDGHLHHINGPAMWWPSGEAYHFWRGVQVPAWVIEEPGKITVEAIRAELNQEIRRGMVEIYGRRRYLRDTGAHLVHKDGFGRLWEAEGATGEHWRFVEVENGTAEPDGSRRTYTLDVTGAAEMLGWPIETARAAVAATYGLRPEEYQPEVRT